METLIITTGIASATAWTLAFYKSNKNGNFVENIFQQIRQGLWLFISRIKMETIICWARAWTASALAFYKSNKNGNKRSIGLN